MTPDPPLVIDHPFLPCFYSKYTDHMRRYSCQSPYGPDRCHIQGCGKTREEHLKAEDSE